jgi:hypothetical protein
VDVVVEMAGTDDAITTAVSSARPGARIALGGIPSEARSSFPGAEARRKGLTFLMVRRMHDTYPGRSPWRPPASTSTPWSPPASARRRGGGVRERGRPHGRQDGGGGQRRGAVESRTMRVVAGSTRSGLGSRSSIRSLRIR